MSQQPIDEEKERERFEKCYRKRFSHVSDRDLANRLNRFQDDGQYVNSATYREFQVWLAAKADERGQE